MMPTKRPRRPLRIKSWKNRSVVGRGDDAQLLAGATLALLQRPNRYGQNDCAARRCADD